MHGKASWTSRESGKTVNVVPAWQRDHGPRPGPARRSCFIHTARQFREIFERERVRSDRSGLGFSLLVFDVDGSRPRHLVAYDLEKTLVAHLRSRDEAGWLDDECLGIVLPGTSAARAQRLAGDIREALSKESPFPKGDVYRYPHHWSLENGNRLDEVIAKLKATTPCTTERDRRTFASGLGIDSASPSFSSPSSLPVWKRTMDIGGALIGLVVLSPLMLAVAAFIKVVSPGPALFRQRRIGLVGKPFTMFKFRTMQLGTDSSFHERYVAELIEHARRGDATAQKPMTKLEGHPSMIPLGRLLRRTCLDETPQLINVLRGEMTLIGPRPPLAYEVQRYPEWCFERLSVPPGMTGLWQVSGKNRLSFEEMVRLDIRYVRKMSLWLDLLILLKTPVAIAREIVNAIA